MDDPRVQQETEWERHTDVLCVQCPNCGFTFAAIHNHTEESDPGVIFDRSLCVLAKREYERERLASKGRSS